MQFVIVYTYWLTGCLFVGLALAAHWDRCPADKLPEASEVLASIAVWPVPLVGVLASKNPHSASCKETAP